MECARLQKLIKGWYLQVQDESMAPARMVEFMRTHIADCLTCMADPIVEKEVARITEIVLPPSKIPKAVRREEREAEDDDVEDDEDTDDTTDDSDDDEDEDDIDPDDEDDEV